MKERNTVREAREESSSSPNVNLVVTGVFQRGTSGRVYSLDLADGSSFFLHTLIYDQPLPVVGDDLGDEELDLLERSHGFYCCLKKGADLCARAEQSPAGLRLKLQKREFPPEILTTVIAELQRQNFLNDERFAEAWIRSRLKMKADSRRYMAKYLQYQGISPEITKSLLDKYVTSDYNQIAKAVKKIRKRKSITEKEITRKLLSKGFSVWDIRAWLAGEGEDE